MKEFLNAQQYGAAGVKPAPFAGKKTEPAQSGEPRVKPGLPGLKRQSTYYSPREYGTQADAMNAQVEAARAEMERQAALLKQQQTAMETARAEAERQRNRYYELKDRFEGDSAGEYRRRLEEEWTASVQAFDKARTAYQQGQEAYAPYEQAYNRAAVDYNAYMDKERSEYDAWRSNIRDAESIRLEMKDLGRLRTELEHRMKGGADVDDPAANETRIRELQSYLGALGEREKLLQEELEWSEHFVYEGYRQNADFAELSRYQPGNDAQYNQVNIKSGAYQQDLFRDDALAGIYWYMEEPEVAMYNYLYSSQGAEAAQKYVAGLEPELNRRRTEETTGQVREWAGKSPLNAALASAGSVLISPISGFEAAVGQLAAKARGEEIDPNAEYNMFSNVKNAVRDEVGGMVEENFGPVGSFMYDTGMSMADMLADKAVAAGNPAVAFTLIESRNFAETVIDGKERGLSDREAMSLGVASAAAELITERLGVDELLHLPKGWTDKGFWKGAFKGMIGEAGEEGLTNILNFLADNQIAGEKSRFNQSIEQHKAAGLSDRDAVVEALKEAGISLALDTLGGGLSGAVFGGYQGWQGKRAADKAAKEATDATQADPDNTTVQPDNETGNPDSGMTAPDNGTPAPVAGGIQEKAASQEEPKGRITQQEPAAIERRSVKTMAETNGGMTSEADAYAREHVLSGGIERADRAGAREQTESYAERQERQQREAQSASQTAAQRRVKAENLEKLGRVQRVSLQDMGIRQGAEARTVLELPKYEWDEDLYNTVSRLEKETGYKVRCVTGNFPMKAEGGGTKLVRGCIDRVSGQIVLNVAHSTVTAGQIADHELYHWKMDAIGRISGDRHQLTREAVRRIREEYDQDSFDSVLDAYLDGYGEVYDTGDEMAFLERIYEEIMADAYSGINAFGAEASKFQGTVNRVLDENGLGRDLWNASEQEDVPAPGGDQRIYTDEDAPPVREYEDYSQVPEEEYGPADDWQIPFSYGGKQDEDNGVFSNQEIAAIQNIGRVSVNQFDDAAIRATKKLARRYWREMGVKSPFFRAWFGDWRANDRTPVIIATEKGNERGIQKNTDTGWDVQISGKVFSETKAHTESFNIAARAYLPYINDIARKAVLLDTHAMNPEKLKSPNSLLMHELYAVADIGKGPEVIKVYVEEMYDPNKPVTTKRGYQLQNIEKYRPAGKGSQSLASPISPAAGTIRSVADLFAHVKSLDTEFMPNPPSKIANPDGTPKIMYHGTNAEWYAYDLSKNTNQMWGEGIYLAETPERARLYGDNIKALYVSARYNNRDAKRLGVKRDHTVMKNGDVLVYSPEQIKSADGNVGTFNNYDDDIRFSVDDIIDEEGNPSPEGVEGVGYARSEPWGREDYDRLMREVRGDQNKRNDAFIRDRLTTEQYKRFKAFQKEDQMDAEDKARARGIERFEKAMEREELEVLRRQQAEDAAAGRRELTSEKKVAAEQAAQLRQTARQERRNKAQREREKARQEARDRVLRAGDAAPTGSAPTIAKKELQDRLIGLFSVGEGQRNELRKMIGDLADRMIAEGSLDERDLRRLIDRLYDSGVMVIEPEEVYAEGRNYIKDEHIYISPELIRELGDNWETLRKRAWGLGVYLSTDRKYAGLDVWNRDMASYLPGMFNENDTDQRTMLERLLWVAEEGKAEKVSLVEYTKRIAKAEHQSEEALLFNMERQVEEALRTFAEKASLETRLKDRAARRQAMDREEAAIAREAERAERERLREDLKDERAYHREQNAAGLQRIKDKRAEMELRNARERRRLAEERAARRQKSQEAKRKKELKELQQKTLNALNWLSKNRRVAPEAIQAAMDEVLGNIDLYAVSMADEMNWSSKYGATWKDLKQLYLHAQTEDPNFLPSDDLQRIVDRLDKTQLEELDLDQLRDLYQAAVGLRTEFQNRNNVIGDAEWEMMEELYSGCVEEMRTAPKKLKGVLDKLLNLEQLTPMNVFEEMGGFNPDGMLYRFAKQLEAGEKAVRSFKVRANKLLADFLTENEEWVRNADGQGKDGEWIKCEIPELIAMKVGEPPQLGGTMTVWMTPMQRVHLYLESRNYDNLRHMTGGRTFPDKELYSKGEREEAFARGTTIRMAPETVQLLVKDLTPQERELAQLLDRYYNDLAKAEINKVSNVLLGYDKAMGGKYAPIFTNGNYTKSEFGKYDGTAEGVGNLKERVKSKLPSYNISALEAFERNMDRTATYVGMAIPARNWNALMNWRTSNSSFADEITHTWGKGRLDYIQALITDLQNPMGEQQDMVSELAGKIQSNYISATFGFNPGIVVKQLGSIPMASAYLGWKHFPKGVVGKGKIDRSLIGKYTQELEWRTMGYSMPETKQLKDAPNWSQKNKTVGLIFGGDAITAMDGWAASVLWPWAENKVRADFPDLEVGDAAMVEAGLSPFYKKVAEVFDDAVSRSQSVSDQMHQGRLRKSKNPITKAFTMFRSDSAQSYNVLRQMLGEMDYYRRQGKSFADHADKAKTAVGAAATAILINSLWGTTVDLLVKALKGKLDEEDKEPLEIVEDFFWGVIDSYAGLVAVGDILAELVGGWFTGEQRYDTEAPGIEQFNDILDAADKVINAGRKGNVIGAIKTAAETLAVYGGGLPVKNVEAYLKGLLSVFLPGVVVSYEDMLKAPVKADLSGLEGEALLTRMNHVLKDYGIELSREDREKLAALYEAGFREVVPSAAPDAVTVDGVELELDERMRKAYDKTRSGIVNEEIVAVLESTFFTEADEKTRKLMLTKLYGYAAEKAKAAVLEDYEIQTSTQAIDEIIGAGGSGADYFLFDAVTADMAAWQKAAVLQEWVTDETVTGLMFKYMVSKSWEDELAELGKVGVDMGQFLELYAMHGEIDTQDLEASAKATNFAYWLDGQGYNGVQKSVIKDQMAFFQFMPAEASRYNTATAAGLDRDQALELTKDLNALDPSEGKTSVQDVQKWRVAVDNAWRDDRQLQMLKAAGMNDASYAKCEALWSVGVAPAAYVRAKELESQFNEDGEDTLKNTEWTKLIESMTTFGVVLPGNTEQFHLTAEQKSFLWQVLTGSKSTKNNPWGSTGGEKWLEIKEQMKKDEE